MRAVVIALVLSALVLLLVTGSARTQAPAHVDRLRIEGTISAIVADYLERGLTIAQRDGAEALLLVLNTPGGDLNATLRIMGQLENAPLPVIVYVAPRGGMAMSAGTFIALAAQAVGMAPKTTLGAAHPVALSSQEVPKEMMEKQVNALVAQVKNYARRRGPEAMDWAERAVRESLAIGEQEALEMGLIDAVAESEEDLLQQLDGLTVPLAGRSVRLHTAQARIIPLPMTPLERLLHIVIDPNIAFILLTLGLNALLFELSSPGGYVAGVVGTICLALAAYALGVLPVNTMGLVLIGLAFVLFLLDIKAPTHGALTLGGIAILALGAMVLFNQPYYHVFPHLVITIAGATGAFFAFAVANVVKAHRRPATTGREGMVGLVGEVRVTLEPEGMVLVRGERWQAVAEEGSIPAGEWVEVVGVEGLRLRVRRAQKGAGGQKGK